MVNLEAWCLNTRILMSSFMWVDLSHVYREHNRREDILSKEGLHLALGHLLLTEFFGNEIIGDNSSQLFQNMLILLQLISSDSLRYFQVLLSNYYCIQETLSLLGSGLWAPAIFFRDIDDCIRQPSYERDHIVVISKCFEPLCYTVGILLVFFCVVCIFGQDCYHYLLFCPWWQSAHFEDVKSSFDSLNTKECIFSTEKKTLPTDIT